MTKLSTPKALEESMMVFMQGMRTSQPSRPNRFSDDHFLARNSSNLKQHKVQTLSFFFFATLYIEISLSVDLGGAELWRILSSLSSDFTDKHGKTQ